MNLKIYEDSKNYTCQVIRLPNKNEIKGLDNLVEIIVQGNSCLIGKDSPEDQLYLFFPAESQISHEFLSKNNLYRRETLNEDITKKGFFEDNRRVKVLKFRGIISSGFVVPLNLLTNYLNTASILLEGEEFNEILGKEVCRKYISKLNPGKSGFSNFSTPKLDSFIYKLYTPEHIDTAHLMKNTDKLNHSDYIVISYKLHGTSGRTFRALVRKKLSIKNKIAKFFGVKVVDNQYDYITASRRQIKSIGFEELPNKNHYYTEGDLWSEWSKKNLEGKLNKGEAIYYEIIGKTYSGQEIQGGYSYNYQEPVGCVYRISNINPDGIEIDLSHDQMEVRAKQLGLRICPILYKGTLSNFIETYDSGQAYVDFQEPLTRIFYDRLLEKPSILDDSVVEEGFCLRVEGKLRAEIYKIKSRMFLANETKALDKEITNIENEQS